MHNDLSYPPTNFKLIQAKHQANKASKVHATGVRYPKLTMAETATQIAEQGRGHAHLEVTERFARAKSPVDNKFNNRRDRSLRWQ